MQPKTFWELTKQTFWEWNEDNVQRLSGSLAFFTLLSLAPLVVIVVAIAGVFFGAEAVRGEIVGQMQSLVGRDGAQVVQTVLANTQKHEGGLVAFVLSFLILLFSASAVFGQLQSALNTIWEVTPKPGLSFRYLVQDRFFSFLMVLGTGFLLLVSLILSAALAALGKFAEHRLPVPADVIELINMLVSLAVIALIFAMIFKYVPDVRVAWQDVWIGAIVSALLFTMGKFAIGLYLGRSSTASAYGAAGSLVVLLIWTYYSSQVFFLGAEFTQVWARRYGAGMRPRSMAVPVTEEERAQQGIPHKETVDLAVAAAEGRLPMPPSVPEHPLLPPGRFRVESKWQTAAVLGVSLGLIAANTLWRDRIAEPSQADLPKAA